MINKKHYEKMTKSEAKKVEKLRDILNADTLPDRKIDNNLLIATFNIRAFGHSRRKSFAINALAEICSRFDIIAIQELRGNLSDLDRMLKVMGPHWTVLFNDTAGDAANKGNDERFAFLYDSRVIEFTGMAAELLITDDFLGAKGVPDQQRSIPWRTPYMASFRAANFDFMLLTVHIQWNSAGGISMRSKEISTIANWIAKRKDQLKLYDPDIFVLGDFNIPGLKSKAFKALADSGLAVPTAHRSFRSNLKKNAHYDQIAYFEDNTDCECANAGRIDFFDAFFTKSMSKSKYGAMTFQISDHYPLWMEVKLKATGFDQYIKRG